MNWLMLTGREEMNDTQRSQVRGAALIGGLIVAAVIVIMMILKDML